MSLCFASSLHLNQNLRHFFLQIQIARPASDATVVTASQCPSRKQRCVIPVLRHDQQCNACASLEVHIHCMNKIKANVTQYSAGKKLSQECHRDTLYFVIIIIIRHELRLSRHVFSSSACPLESLPSHLRSIWSTIQHYFCHLAAVYSRYMS